MTPPGGSCRDILNRPGFHRSSTLGSILLRSKLDVRHFGWCVGVDVVTQSRGTIIDVSWYTDRLSVQGSCPRTIDIHLSTSSIKLRTDFAIHYVLKSQDFRSDEVVSTWQIFWHGSIDLSTVGDHLFGAPLVAADIVSIPRNLEPTITGRRGGIRI